MMMTGQHGWPLSAMSALASTGSRACLLSDDQPLHLLVETVDGNLTKGMRQSSGVYTQRFNHHHGMVGHLFQGRYKAILIQKDTYLLELRRYVVLESAESPDGLKT